MKMNQIASLVLVILGVVLLACGWDAYRSVSSDVSRVFTGAPTDRALWLLVGGGVATVVGLGGLSRRG
jgi:hypothetical protein